MRKFLLFVLLVILAMTSYMAYMTHELPYGILAVLAVTAIIACIAIFLHPRYAALYAAIEIAGLLGIKSYISDVTLLMTSKPIDTDIFLSIKDAYDWPLVVAMISLLVFQRMQNWSPNIKFGFAHSSGNGNTSIANSSVSGLNTLNAGDIHKPIINFGNNNTYNLSSEGVTISPPPKEAQFSPEAVPPDRETLHEFGRDLLNKSIQDNDWFERDAESKLIQMIVECPQKLVQCYEGSG